MQQEAQCPICSKTMSGSRAYCSLDCKRELNKRRWRQPLSDEQFRTMLDCLRSMPADAQELFSDGMVAQKFAIDISMGRGSG